MGYLDGKKVLVTGGTGSLGQSLTARMLSGQHGTPRAITIMSRGSTMQHIMKEDFDSPLIEFFQGDVSNLLDMMHAVEGQDVIIHAAAMKHVGDCEKWPEKADLINVGGTENLIKALKHRSVDTVVGISSDKGKDPDNWYGATKRKQERIILAANFEIPQTRFICVCYGNVMASNGSVIWRWKNQISHGLRMTINDTNMTRFLISLSQAVDTVMEALEHAARGEVYVPIIPSATVGDLAEVVRGDADVDFQVKGRDKGEKIHETMINEDEALRTVRRGNWYVVTRTIQDKPCLSGPYVSRDYLIGRDELKALLVKYGLLETEREEIIMGSGTD